MKTQLSFVLAAAVLLVPSTLAGTYTGTFTGPGHGFLPGVTATLAPCDPGSASQGVDGYWFDIGHEPPGATYTLAVATTLDADLVFHDSACNFLTHDGATSGLGATLTGVVPAGADWVLVDNFAGSGAFTLTI